MADTDAQREIDALRREREEMVAMLRDAWDMARRHWAQENIPAVFRRIHAALEEIGK